jgi:ribonuclease D
MARRWRSKKGTDKSINNYTFTKSKYWNDAERLELLQYLAAYRNAAHNITCTTECTDVPLVIAGIEFPAINLELPYLLLPSQLSSKQRKVLHELCLQENLFHTSIGATLDDRRIAISIYADGLDYLPLEEQEQNKTTMNILQCKPWFCRRQNSTNDADDALFQRGQKQILELISHPELCLREHMDAADLNHSYHALINTEPAAIKENNSNRCSYILIDTELKMKDCVASLFLQSTNCTELAFDVEAYNKSAQTQITCLLQLTNGNRAYIVDVLAPGVWDQVSDLAPLFANLNIVKVGHSIGGLDVACLHRDFGILVVNVFDTYEAAKELQLPSHGLAAVCEYYGMTTRGNEYAKLKRKYQTCDWRQRPLSRDMLAYARYDIQFLLQLRKCMMRDLVNEQPKQQKQPSVSTSATYQTALQESCLPGSEAATLSMPLEQAVGTVACNNNNNDTNMLTQTDNPATPLKPSVVDVPTLRSHPRLLNVFATSQLRCKSLWTMGKEQHSTNATFVQLLKRASNHEIDWTNANTKLYADLTRWRTRVASQLEILPGFVTPLEFLAAVAWKRPRSTTALCRIAHRLPEALEDEVIAQQLIDIVIKAFGDERDETFYYYSERLQRNQREAILTNAALTVMVCAGVALVYALATGGTKRPR